MKVLLSGDSTVAACPALETPMSGWGSHLGAPLNAYLAARRATEPVVVDVVNVAKGGANTASIRGEGLWDALLLLAEPGDVVVIQFGHNDEKIPTLAARGGYLRNLHAMLDECDELGLVPVLCTPVGRRTFEGARYVDSHGDYPDVVRELAAERGVALVDLTAETGRLYEELGPEGSRSLFTQFAPNVHPLYRLGVSDDTHFSLAGATAVADIVARGILPAVLGALGD